MRDASPHVHGADGRRLRIAVLQGRADPATLATAAVTYQAAQFLHLEEFADVVWDDQAFALLAAGGAAPPVDAVVAFDERSLLTDPRIEAIPDDLDRLFVLITHDFWAHPVKVAEAMSARRRPLMILRHLSAIRLFELLAPGVPKLLQRPGVETSIFRPHDGPKEWDVLLSGSETPDYPHRRRFNRIVREYAAEYGWRLLDLTAIGLVSQPRSGQHEYVPSLAAAKVSPTATNHGGAPCARLVVQYVDVGEVRGRLDDEFYGLELPDVVVNEIPTAGITPRYLESLATRTLLMGDLPACDAQEWYRDKMVVIPDDASDREVAELIDRWVRADEERGQLCARAYDAVVAGETSRHRAAELAEIIAAHA